MEVSKINICKAPKGYNIYTTYPFFKNEYLIIQITEEKIIFRLPTIDYRGKQLKTIKKRGNSRQLSLYSEFIKPGNYTPDEETTEDKLIIYF